MDSLVVNDTCKRPVTKLKREFLSVAKSYKCTQSSTVTAQ